MNYKKVIFKIIIVLIVLWSIMFAVDYYKTTHSFEKPAFAIYTDGVDDGGSGIYKGIGYSIDIKGNFMPEDEFPGVTYARFSMFEKEIKNVTRE